MRYRIIFTSSYKKEYKLVIKQHRDIDDLDFIIDTLSQCKPLDFKYKDHRLKGKYSSCRECHINPDLILIYELDHKNKVLILDRIGSHSNLFK